MSRPQLGWRIDEELKKRFEEAAKRDERDPADQFTWLAKKWLNGELVSFESLRETFTRLGVSIEFRKGKPNRNQWGEISKELRDKELREKFLGISNAELLNLAKKEIAKLESTQAGELSKKSPGGKGRKVRVTRRVPPAAQGPLRETGTDPKDQGKAG